MDGLPEDETIRGEMEADGARCVGYGWKREEGTGL